MFVRLKNLFLTVAPITLLVVVLVASFRLVQSDATDASAALKRPVVQPAAQTTGQVVGQGTPVIPQAVVIEAKSSKERDLTETPAPGEERIGPARGDKKELVWDEINDAIYGLNDIVGADMFLDVKRKQKGQMEIRLDDGLWKRVSYQTRVDLKTDISNLWHLYVDEYGYAGASVVYFLDDSNDRVIDIFSRAN